MLQSGFNLCASDVPQSSGLPYATPAALLPDDPIKAAARYTTKYLIFYLGAHPAIPNASAHIVAPHTALGLRIRDTPVVASNALFRISVADIIPAFV
jgi:hypothetical protein